MMTRRKFLSTGATLAGGAALAQAAEAPPTRARSSDVLPPGQPGKDYRPVVTPNGASLPWKLVDGVKVYHLIATPVEHELRPRTQGALLGL